MIKAIEIVNRKNLVLRGYLNLPTNASKIVVMLHGFTGHRMEHNGHFRTLSRLLSEQGIASIRMDYHGNGESDGEFSDFDFDYLLEDAKDMLSFARRVDGIKEVYVLGFSLGGAVASLVVSDDNADKLLLWSPAGSMAEIARSRFNSAKKLENGNCYFSGFEMSYRFVETIEKYDMYQNTANFTKPVLIIHGENDKSVNILYGQKYNNMYVNSEFYLINETGHGYDEYEKKNELYRKSLNFLV